MSITGTWENSYGSKMVLHQWSDGWVTGKYSSTTGSTGVYYVVGVVDLNDPTSKKGQSVALSIYWRSIMGGQGDPSWHWVSGLAGQLYPDPDTNTPTLSLIHALVSTEPFPAAGAGLGTFMDKLIYTPATGKTDLTAPGELPKFDEKAAADTADPAKGIWVCQEDSSIKMNIENIDPDHGYVSGVIILSGQSYDIWGFTDIHAAADRLDFQSLTLSIGIPDGAAHNCLSLAGSIDYFHDNVLTLTSMIGRGTASNSTYLQTTLSQMTFEKQS